MDILRFRPFEKVKSAAHAIVAVSNKNTNTVRGKNANFFVIFIAKTTFHYLFILITAITRSVGETQLFLLFDYYVPESAA